MQPGMGPSGSLLYLFFTYLCLYDALPFHVLASRDVTWRARQQEKAWADHELGRTDQDRLRSRARNAGPGQNRETWGSAEQAIQVNSRLYDN